MARLSAITDAKAVLGIPRGSARGKLWAVVLAGGQGMRLRPLTRRLYGENRPKQYAALVGSRSMLQWTLDRVALAIPLERTFVIALHGHESYLAEGLNTSPAPRVLIQPEDRGTAAGVLLAAHWIHRHDPDATVATFPADHFIGKERVFMDHVVSLASLAREGSGRIVLVGARPTEAQTEYGWIEPGEPLSRPPELVWQVRRFWEKPSPEQARACLALGCVWNTFVFVARTSTLIETGRRFLPRMHEPLVRGLAAEHGEAARAVHEAFAAMPSANFSQAVLAQCPPGLLVSRLPEVTWCDLGTPDRVARTLQDAGISAPWTTDPDGQPTARCPDPRRAHLERAVRPRTPRPFPTSMLSVRSRPMRQPGGPI